MDFNVLSSNNVPPITEDASKLLFFESFKYDKAQFVTEEIFFGKPIYLHQIRLVKFDINPHPKIKAQPR
jgi:hypothetical protein